MEVLGHCVRNLAILMEGPYGQPQATVAIPAKMPGMQLNHIGMFALRLLFCEEARLAILKCHMERNADVVSVS